MRGQHPRARLSGATGREPHRFENSRRVGFEVKFSEAPSVTRATHNVVRLLALDHLFVVCPTRNACPVDARITVLPAVEAPDLPQRIDAP